MSPAASTHGVGALVERLQLVYANPQPIAVTSIARVSTLATVTTAAAHGYSNGDYVTIAGAVPAQYNGKFKITVTAPNTFTYAVLSTLATPATGTITATYVSDAQGGQSLGWQAFGTPIAAELVPLRAWETLQGPAVQSEIDYRFRVRRRLDVTTTMRAQWKPRWPPGGPVQTLTITGIVPEGDGRRYMLLECKGA